MTAPSFPNLVRPRARNSKAIRKSYKHSLAKTSVVTVFVNALLDRLQNFKKIAGFVTQSVLPTHSDGTAVLCMRSKNNQRRELEHGYR